jgi:hypothetical protein
MSTLNFFTKEDGKDALTGEAVNKKKQQKNSLNLFRYKYR